MHPSYVRIDAASLRRMYVEDRLTTAEIGSRLGCGANTVARRLREFGMRVRPRGPILGRNQDARWINGPSWSADIAWVVGLMATDGNLAGVGHGMSITSKDIDLLESARRCLALSNRFGRVVGGWGTGGHRLQWRSRAFYDWLVAIGLTPRKSLTIGPLVVPDEHFADFFRGCIDGDGTVPCIRIAITRRRRRPMCTRVSTYPSSPRVARSSTGCERRSIGCSASAAASTSSGPAAGGAPCGFFDTRRRPRCGCCPGCTTRRTFPVSPANGPRPNPSS
jgi:hypothetical protein